MPRYLIEGSSDGSIFSESVDANSMADAEAFAIKRLCEAWGEEYGPDTTLDDLGDSAMVSEYQPEDYARDAGPDLLAIVRDALPHIASEVEQRKYGGNAEDWRELEAIEERMVALVNRATAPKGRAD